MGQGADVNDGKLKKALMTTIGDCIDEKMLSTVADSFVEMDNQVIHVVIDGGDRYFRVDLTEVDESEYDKRYWPEGSEDD